MPGEDDFEGSDGSTTKHLEAALENASNTQVRYHIRQALQYSLTHTDDAEGEEGPDDRVTSE